MSRNIYIAGPMTGLPFFNAAAFNKADALLRAEYDAVFNPVLHDCNVFGDALIYENETGDPKQAVAAGFDLRRALGDDTAWICENATHIAMLPGWERSAGARAEHALATALRLDIIYLTAEQLA